MIKNLLICCLVLIGLTACEKEVDMSKLPSSDLYGHQIRDTITSDNTGSNWFSDKDINKWSLWKPIVYNKLAGMTLADFKAAKYGLTIPELTYFDLFQSEEYVYTKPNGNAGQPKRAGDFRNYKQDAVIPYYINFPLVLYHNSNNQALTIDYITTDNGNMLLKHICEATGFRTVYFGVCIIKTHDFAYSPAYYITANAPMLNNGEFAIDLSEFTIPLDGIRELGFQKEEAVTLIPFMGLGASPTPSESYPYQKFLFAKSTEVPNYLEYFMQEYVPNDPIKNNLSQYGDGQILLGNDLPPLDFVMSFAIRGSSNGGATLQRNRMSFTATSAWGEEITNFGNIQFYKDAACTIPFGNTISIGANEIVNFYFKDFFVYYHSNGSKEIPKSAYWSARMKMNYQSDFNYMNLISVTVWFGGDAGGPF